MTMYYRYEYTYGSPCASLMVELRTFPVIKKTPKGTWIGYRRSKKFILDDAKKRWACPTIEDAFISLQDRLKRRQFLLDVQLTLVKGVLNAKSLEQIKAILPNQCSTMPLIDQDVEDVTQIRNLLNAVLDTITQYEWYLDENHPPTKAPIDIRPDIRSIMQNNRLLR